MSVAVPGLAGDAAASTKKEKAKPAPDSGKVAQAGQEDAAKSATKDVHAPLEPVSLVERRLRAIEKSRVASRATGSSRAGARPAPTERREDGVVWPLRAGMLLEEAPERLVTVVVRLVVDEPSKGSTNGRPDAKPDGAKTKRPARTDRDSKDRTQ